MGVFGRCSPEGSKKQLHAASQLVAWAPVHMAKYALNLRRPARRVPLSEQMPRLWTFNMM